MPRSASLTVSVSEPSDTHLSSITSALPDTQQSNSRAGTVGRRRESLNADTFKPSRLSVIPYSPFSRNRSKSPFFAQKNSSTATVDAPGAKDRFDESAQSPISSLASLNVYGPGTDSASLLSVHDSRNTSIAEADEDVEPWAASSVVRVDSTHASANKGNNRFQKLITRARSGGRANEPAQRGPKLEGPPARVASETQSKHVLAEDDFRPSQDPDASNQNSIQNMASSTSSSIRNKSTDRATNNISNHSSNLDEAQMLSRSHPSREGGLLSSIKSSGSSAATGLGRAGKGLFGKITRGSTSTERDQPAEEYKCMVINLPLVEQTRRTRIRSRMEDARDKTEFWMPALPYRCIDYLNLKGVEEEGLYRVPGSGREVKLWQQRFDTELDINLLDEPELYDINIIGSMLKAWLRELPDELFPKSTQAIIARACAGAEDTPQMMKDELSKLPPFNYYILFAITCHISLLHMNSHKNKMNYQNLCICFQPCMKMDPFCFQFLVCDWKNCWQGCWTEREYLDEEYRILNLNSQPMGAGKSQALTDARSTVAVPRAGGQLDNKPVLDSRSHSMTNDLIADGTGPHLPSSQLASLPSSPTTTHAPPRIT